MASSLGRRSEFKKIVHLDLLLYDINVLLLFKRREYMKIS